MERSVNVTLPNNTQKTRTIGAGFYHLSFAKRSPRSRQNGCTLLFSTFFLQDRAASVSHERKNKGRRDEDEVKNPRASEAEEERIDRFVIWINAIHPEYAERQNGDDRFDRGEEGMSKCLDCGAENTV